MLKVSEFKKQIFLSSFEPKDEQNYFLNSALASKATQIKNEGTLLCLKGLFNTTEALIFSLDLLGRNRKNNLV